MGKVSYIEGSTCAHDPICRKECIYYNTPQCEHFMEDCSVDELWKCKTHNNLFDYSESEIEFSDLDKFCLIAAILILVIGILEMIYLNIIKVY
jgi:hypothetical protein